nr:ribosomal protein L32 [Cyanidiococcus yangmingshanensis]
MAVPKKRTPKSKTRSRKSQWMRKALKQLQKARTRAGQLSLRTCQIGVNRIIISTTSNNLGRFKS